MYENNPNWNINKMQTGVRESKIFWRGKISVSVLFNKSLKNKYKHLYLTNLSFQRNDQGCLFVLEICKLQNPYYIHKVHSFYIVCLCRKLNCNILKLFIKIPEKRTLLQIKLKVR